MIAGGSTPASVAAPPIGQLHRGHQGHLALIRLTHESRVDPVQHQLGPTEHLERAVVADVTPREVEEPLAPLAVDRRATEVERALLVDPSATSRSHAADGASPGVSPSGPWRTCRATWTLRHSQKARPGSR